METLSGGQRQGVAVVRAAAFGSRVVIMDEPTAALGVKESRKVLELILDVKKRGLPIVLISHNMPHVFEVADRIHIHRLGRRIAVINPAELYDVRCGRDHDRRHEAAADARTGLTSLRPNPGGEEDPGRPRVPRVPVDGPDHQSSIRWTGSQAAISSGSSCSSAQAHSEDSVWRGSGRRFWSR